MICQNDSFAAPQGFGIHWRQKKSEILSSCYFSQASSQLEFALTKETKSFGVAYKLYTVL